ncbi:hypothetical protein KC343_g10825 [Hortaea werneckii]|uniref:Uncharacterized protein n=1 Tax=Hortaea werneckii TaxID=91943 RepID=A0A3M7GSE4_HORWE|nr:hypothetical protein KC352_g20060 [Hortaea werneckii]KAI7558449.1 hypothetical protein KC317_g10998 [Hortaea werneckii]KAI7606065.1 hypothetical protein KC346_g10721 [Hortaea werneckii]KAI7613573.1 hypothetical protein KC343_g10825 [Hortaea werneckii]KAI7654515.1 hypothetical protein KC319_g10242 [Hortaea werneckii]
MPGCVYNHPHVPWPTVGPLTICDGERTCGFCKGPEATIKYADAANLRKHVYHTHTDGGFRDQRSVEVLMYRPWIRAAAGKATEGGKRSHDGPAHNRRPRLEECRVKALTGGTSAEGAALPAERTTSPGGHAQTTGHELSSTAVSAEKSTEPGQPALPTRPKKWMSEAGKASHRRRMAEIKKKAREAKEAGEAEDAIEATEQAKAESGERTN